jgi:hypothetical protein
MDQCFKNVKQAKVARIAKILTARKFSKNEFMAAATATNAAKKVV